MSSAGGGGGRCEYCGADLFSSSDVFYFGRQFDHVTPCCANGRDGPENRALACRPCNLIKLRYSPVGNSRAERIADAAREIKSKRERNDPRLAKDRASYYGEARRADAP